ncbi:MRNA-capping enzyme isoform X2 [Aix galericulata]|nr:MRNA-capping enzyme isoform X2 [Aix galericulata]
MLGPRYDDQVAEENRFHPSMLSNYLKSLKVKMGLLVDLTNTTRFYDRNDIEKEGIKYIKLQCKGIEAAVATFAQARPPGIYKGDYLKELFRRYGDEDDAPSPPELPEWCFEDDEEEDDDSGRTGGQESEPGSSSSSFGKRRKERLKLGAIFLEGITVKCVTQVTTQPKLGGIQQKCQQFCGWEGSGFPGAQPVSMDKQNIKFLEQKPYKVSWKADGTRAPVQFGMEKTSKGFGLPRQLLEGSFAREVSHEVDGLIFQPTGKLKAFTDHEKNMGSGNAEDELMSENQAGPRLWLLQRDRPAVAVCNSIQNPVTKEMLFEFIDRCTAASQGQTRKHHLDPDTELMPPPPPKRPRTIT